MTEVDPFAGADKVPSLSFKNAEVGTTYNGTITEGPKLVQSRDFKTQQPAVWENKDGSTSPKMAVVLRMKVDELADNPEGDERAVWATKPSALFAALHEAQKTAGDGTMKVGGRLALRYTGDKPAAGGDNLNPAKQYAAKYTPPVASATASEDPWASAPTGPAF